MNQRQYEAMFIAKPELSDADVNKLGDKFKSIIEGKGGTITEGKIWDKRRLAYEIQGYREGTYYLLQFECGPDVPHEVNRLMSINDDVIRHRLFQVGE
ncbi:MAG: 30S ribosomal protein S6 [Fimbriimonadaceae bacterium]|uniref:Small ribosomal subunit protein bS6 n=1 Tax=Candidatus Nitrosymbiomonas proteolyticus TaxID=2608984 RepID=A0A809SBG5_9BACT|nr:MAG: 30S ribosomal protein S6 [Armatimonadota bacterium]MBV6490637.1 30S ribosomal protein S6 [Fimbriimonadaceae bacterium]QOJ10559.1 MAG: 30S ribosomal protein S6 [Chthonomonadaceae bacterium]BBO24951.1 30S ribosomal protein S6 [Candidatus Nitrosymbiomonas proteolyticus]MCK6632282.1 30S ribosomal protein S6 [Fimbriimonadaceae bacterium]